MEVLKLLKTLPSLDELLYTKIIKTVLNNNYLTYKWLFTKFTASILYKFENVFFLLT